MTRSLPISILLSAALLAVAVPAANAASYFKFDGVDGRSPERPTLSDFSIVKSLDKP